MMSIKITKHGGFTLLELLIAVGISSIFIFIGATVIAQLGDEQSRAMSAFKIGQFQRFIIQSLSYEQAWNNTTQAGSASGAHPLSKMDCLISSVPCTIDGTAGGAPIQNQAFALYDTTNNLVFDSTPATRGLTFNTSHCDAFLAAGNDACPYRYDLEWSALCEVGNCIDPMIKISAKFKYAPSTNRVAINPLDYTIESFYKLPANLPPPPLPCIIPIADGTNTTDNVIYTACGRGSGNLTINGNGNTFDTGGGGSWTVNFNGNGNSINFRGSGSNMVGLIGQNLTVMGGGGGSNTVNGIFVSGGETCSSVDGTTATTTCL